MLSLLLFLSAAAAAPALYDQRQDGKLNFQADLKNVVLVVAVPEKALSNNLMGSLGTLLSVATKSNNEESKVQERSQMRVMEAFVEPSEPYRVEIGESTGNVDRDGDGRTVEVVIAGRRSESSSGGETGDELKLLGAMENCGPGRERDPDTLACREQTEPPAEPSPESGTLADEQPVDLEQDIKAEHVPETTQV